MLKLNTIIYSYKVINESENNGKLASPLKSPFLVLHMLLVMITYKLSRKGAGSDS